MLSFIKTYRYDNGEYFEWMFKLSFRGNFCYLALYTEVDNQTNIYYFIITTPLSTAQAMFLKIRWLAGSVPYWKFGVMGVAATANINQILSTYNIFVIKH